MLLLQRYYTTCMSKKWDLIRQVGENESANTTMKSETHTYNNRKNIYFNTQVSDDLIRVILYHITCTWIYMILPFVFHKCVGQGWRCEYESPPL